ncbi:DNA topoisomerase [Medicago truncatula]|uniref:DNA topoisomerase (ATP-hydrolyzing) n=1 Tax=Medicago truncatula TaxID=3880 RepID=A0A072V5L2_MEDTR|nr:DNA topoisomerase [Medicago truncatula]
MQSKLGLKTITCEDGEKWTKVIVKLDLKMFNMKCFEDNIVALMKKCVVDMTGILGRTIKDYAKDLCQSQEQFEKTYSMKKTKLACHLAKLEDANYVGDPMESNKCILILTKGDFANALVMSGLSVDVRNY